jgi:hypothetical protein
LFDLAIVFSPFYDPRGISPFLLGEDKCLRRGLARNVRDDATLRRGRRAESSERLFNLFPAARQ